MVGDGTKAEDLRPAPSPQLAYLTPEYLADRRDMLAARLSFDGAELGYGDTLSDCSVLRGATSTDIDSSIMLAIVDSVMGYEGKDRYSRS